MATAFFKKYPDADPSRFVFRNEKVFFKINPDNEYRLADIEYRVFQDSPEWTKYLTSYKDRGFGIWFADGTVQPYKKNPSEEDVNNFPVHVTDEKYFASSLPQLPITNSSSSDYKQNPYLAAIVAAYVSTYVCGISTKHMEFSDRTPGIVTSMVRYHLYYQISRFLRDPSKLDRYVSSVPDSVKKHKPTNDVWTKAYHQGSEELLTWLSEQTQNKKLSLLKKRERNRYRNRLRKNHGSVSQKRQRLQNVRRDKDGRSDQTRTKAPSTIRGELRVLRAWRSGKPKIPHCRRRS